MNPIKILRAVLSNNLTWRIKSYIIYERYEVINDLIQLLNVQRMITQFFMPNIDNIKYMTKKYIFIS